MARILHLSDTHLGLTTRAVDRLGDHRVALAEICEIAGRVRPHVTLHTGDLFHTPHPSNDAVKLAFTTLHRLAEHGPVIVLRGNHDGIHHFQALQAVLSPGSRIHLVDVPRHPDAGGVIEVPGEGDEVLRIAVLPFLESNRGRIIDRLTDWQTWQTQYADGVAGVERLLGDALEEGYDPARHILVFAAHLHLDVAVPSRSERARHVVEEYAARASSIPRSVAYAAFGHIHNPQRLRAAMPAWYAGSPIPVDFGEMSDRKRVLSVAVRPGRGAEVTEHVLEHPGRRMLRIDATLEEIAARAAEVGDAICEVVVRSRTSIPDAAERVAALLPAASFASIENAAADARMAPLAGGGAGEATAAEGVDVLFRRFLEGLPASPGVPAQLLQDVFCALLDDPEQTHRFAAEAPLDRPDAAAAGSAGGASAPPTADPPAAASAGGRTRRPRPGPHRRPVEVGR
jgi:DNA repair protein SbcD/Mre11